MLLRLVVQLQKTVCMTGSTRSTITTATYITGQVWELHNGINAPVQKGAGMQSLVSLLLSTAGACGSVQIMYGVSPYLTASSALM